MSQLFREARRADGAKLLTECQGFLGETGFASPQHDIARKLGLPGPSGQDGHDNDDAVIFVDGISADHDTARSWSVFEPCVGPSFAKNPRTRSRV